MGSNPNQSRFNSRQVPYSWVNKTKTLKTESQDQNLATNLTLEIMVLHQAKYPRVGKGMLILPIY